MMSFAQFHATRVFSDDLARDVASENWAMGEGQTPKGYLYLSCLYIEQVQPYWPEASRKQGEWYLILNRDEYITNDLPALEEKLFRFAVSEGYGDGMDGGFPEEPEGASIDDLCEEYKRFNEAHCLDLGSADEHLFDENLTVDQRTYLQSFCRRWDEAMEREFEAEAMRRRAEDEGVSDRLSKATPLLLKALRMVEEAIRKNAGEDTPVLLHEEEQAAVQAALDALDGK